MRTVVMSLLVFSFVACGGSLGDGAYDAPLSDAGSDRVILLGESTTLDAFRSCDPAGGSVAFTWSLLSQPEGSSLALSGNITHQKQLVVTPAVTGSYLFALRVNVGERIGESAFVTIVVSDDEDTVSTTDLDHVEATDRCGVSY